jgi:hypothetical protein
LTGRAAATWTPGSFLPEPASPIINLACPRPELLNPKSKAKKTNENRKHVFEERKDPVFIRTILFLLPIKN